MERIDFNGYAYPKWQAEGFAAQFCFPFAQKVCKGIGVDVGCMKVEWSLPGSIPVDIAFENGMDAMNLPDQLDYVFSSHCLEHLPNYVEAVEYWLSRIKSGGHLFLYLPNMEVQDYWRPWNNRKHVHYLTPKIMDEFFLYLERKGLVDNYFIAETDMNASFTVIAQKA